MSGLEVINSSFTVTITMQIWPPDSLGSFLDALTKRGFSLTDNQSVKFLAFKYPISNIGVDYPTRRIFFQITNNLTNPHQNVEEVLSIISESGYRSEESIERIDVAGNVTIKVQDDAESEFVHKVVSRKFTERTSTIFDRPMRTVGIRISPEGTHGFDLDKSPFMLLIEPLFTDPAKRKFLIQITSSSRSGEQTTHFLESLYERLMKILVAMKNE